MKEKGPCPATGNCKKQFLKGDAACRFCKRRKRDMAPKKEPEKVPEPEPDETEETEETLEDAFGNEAEHLWWVPMEFTHEFEGEGKVRFTFSLKVAGRDEEDARDTAEGITMEQIVDDSDFDGLDADGVRTTLEDSESVCEAEYESWDCEDIVLRVNNDADVEECFD